MIVEHEVRGNRGEAALEIAVRDPAAREEHFSIATK